MGYLSASYSPHSLYRIEFGRIWRQEDKYQAIPMRFEEGIEFLRPVPPGVVQDKIDFAFRRAEKITDKFAKGLSVESEGFLCKQTAGFQVERPEEAHFVTDRRREYARLFSFWRPHSYQTAVALEMNFVLAPELNGRVLH